MASTLSITQMSVVLREMGFFNGHGIFRQQSAWCPGLADYPSSVSVYPTALLRVPESNSDKLTSQVTFRRNRCHKIRVSYVLGT